VAQHLCRRRVPQHMCAFGRAHNASPLHHAFHRGRPTAEGQFEVFVGQRRLLACQKIKLDPVPCSIWDDISTRDAVAMSLAENLLRADMLPLDKAYAIKALYDLYRSYGRVAKETSS
jgi:ParB/RepB/Spo0J family partition protein